MPLLFLRENLPYNESKREKEVIKYEEVYGIKLFIRLDHDRLNRRNLVGVDIYKRNAKFKKIGDNISLFFNLY